MVFQNDDKFVVEWKYKKLNGQGTMSFAYGAKYAGEWKEDIFISKSKPFL